MPEQVVRRKLVPQRVAIHELGSFDRRGDFGEVLLPYGRDEAIAEAQRCIQCAKPWCVEACPIAQDARGYLRLVASGDFEGARDLILRDNPLASCLGRVCYRYCEDACPVRKKGNPVAIRHVKRAALEYAGLARPYRAEPPNGQHVAVVGGGPAGLTVAWVLGQRGYEITIFEAADHLGGLMTGTIPRYRLPDGVFEEDLARLALFPIHFRYGIRFPREIGIDELLADFDAVFIATGTHNSRPLRIPGENLDGVVPALPFLKEVRRGERSSVRPRTVVIGGGDVAIDSARSALRLGAEEVTILYRRSRQEMPADDEEIQAAMDEGVTFVFLVAPLRFLGERRLEGVELQPMVLGPPDASGRCKPIRADAEPFIIRCDTAIVATGQVADLDGIPPELGVSVGDDGNLVTSAATGETTRPGVYAGGGGSVVHAMAAGKRAALAIDAYLTPKRAGPS